MKQKSTKALLCALFLGFGLSLSAQQLAFPGAQGWGRFATGGRTGTVYHVTNLNDSGTGSFRDAVSQSNRIVVFDVSGVINISSRIVFSNNLYVAGQTAPGEGIVVYGDGVSFSGATNTIVRYMRFRMGKGGTSGKDAAGIANGTNMIFDHCSFSWGLDETFSINPDGKGTDPINITIQNSIMGQGLLTHSAGGLMQSDSITLYRNLYCDNSTRNNKIKGINQYVNNIVYNWSNGCYLMGGDSEGSSYVNATNNLFINGPSGGGNAFTSGNSDFHIYAEDNWQDKNKNGVFDPYEIPQSEYSGGPTFQTEPYNYPTLEAWNATDLIEKLLPEVGASLPYRDLADHYMVHQVKSFGTEGALISTEEQLPFGAPSTWTMKSFDKPTDTDGDGMPDIWETANGTDPTVDDAMTIASNGYANIENYINSLSTENRTMFLREPMMPATKASTDTTITISWSDYTEGEDGFIIEQLVDSDYTEIGRAGADTEEYTIENLTAGTAYTLRLKAYKGTDTYSDAVKFTAKTQPEKVEMVDCDTFVGDDDRNWLIAPETDQTYTLNDSTEKDAVVVRTDADVTITGNGSLTGTMSLNKTKAGKLTLETENSYTGATVLHDGTISFSTLKDGGVASGIGASQDYAQNWIWDGGTWNYTGESTSTNRYAQIYNDTEFNIENASTVTMTGSIEGAGDVTVSGKGTLLPSSEAFFGYDGNTVLKDGATLKISYLSSLTNKLLYMDNGTDLNKLVLAGGNFNSAGGTKELYISYMFPIEVKDSTYSTFAITKHAYIKSAVTGSGTMEFKIPYVREYLSGDWTKFYGTLIANGIGTDNEGSQLMLQSGFKGFPNAVVKLTGNTRAVGWATTAEMPVGGISGDKGTYLSATSKKTTTAVMTWRVGGAGTNETFNGIIDNRTSASNYEATTNIIKEGQGDWTLTGSNTYKGTTKVNGGRLIVNGKNSGTGAYTVAEGATLAGSGTIGGKVTLNSGSTLLSDAGDTLVCASSLAVGALTVGSGATVYTPANSTQCNSITLNAGMTIGDDAILQLADEQLDKAPYDATTYQVFNVTGTITGTFAQIIPATPGEGQTWDTSALYTDGVLKVVGGEENPNPDTPDNPDTLDTSTKSALITWGNTTESSYDGSDYNNMLTGAEEQNAGFSLVITGNLAKYYSAADKISIDYEGETISRTTIKLSNGAENTLYLPSGATATKLTLWSYTNYTKDTTPRTSYWASVAGTDYTEDTATILQSTKNTSNPDMVEFVLDNVANSIAFKNTGEQQCVIVGVEYNYGSANGISNVSASSSPISVEYYTLDGKRVNEPANGLYIMRATMADGKIVTSKVVR